jgi:hypothetical protein
MDEKQKVLLLPVVKKRRWITSELTRRREFNQASPDESSYKTRSRRSRPTICWVAPRQEIHLRRSRRSGDGAAEGDALGDDDATGDERLEPRTVRSPWPIAHAPATVSNAPMTNTPSTTNPTMTVIRSPLSIVLTSFLAGSNPTSEFTRPRGSGNVDSQKHLEKHAIAARVQRFVGCVTA